MVADGGRRLDECLGRKFVRGGNARSTKMIDTQIVLMYFVVRDKYIGDSTGWVQLFQDREKVQESRWNDRKL